MSKSNADVDRIVEVLMDQDLDKAQRMQSLRELVRVESDIPDELMNAALRKLMERITE